jgi:hypothetical protein
VSGIATENVQQEIFKAQGNIDKQACWWTKDRILFGSKGMKGRIPKHLGKEFT